MSHEDKLIAELLIGCVKNDNHGLPQHRFMRDGSDEENAARRALAKLLRNPGRRLDTGLRWTLAELIEPDDGYDPSSRRIKFENRRRGAPLGANATREKTVAEFIWSRMEANCSEKAAKREAAEKFGFSTTVSNSDHKNSRVSAIWQRWRPILERLKRSNLKGGPVDPFAE